MAKMKRHGGKDANDRIVQKKRCLGEETEDQNGILTDVILVLSSLCKIYD